MLDSLSLYVFSIHRKSLYVNDAYIYIYIYIWRAVTFLTGYSEC